MKFTKLFSICKTNCWIMTISTALCFPITFYFFNTRSFRLNRFMNFTFWIFTIPTPMFGIHKFLNSKIYFIIEFILNFFPFVVPNTLFNNFPPLKIILFNKKCILFNKNCILTWWIFKFFKLSNFMIFSLIQSDGWFFK